MRSTRSLLLLLGLGALAVPSLSVPSAPRAEASTGQRCTIRKVPLRRTERVRVRRVVDGKPEVVTVTRSVVVRVRRRVRVRYRHVVDGKPRLGTKVVLRTRIVYRTVRVCTPASTQVPATQAASGSPVQPLGVPGSWKLVFDDEMSGTALDTTHWSYGAKDGRYLGPLNGNETENYAASQVAVGGGALTLSDVTRANRYCSDDPYGQGCTTEPYLSGAVSTYGKFSFTYGYAEARVYTPGSAASGIYNWPAFWLTGEDLDWPTSGEIDVFEGLGGQAAYHFNYGSPDNVIYTGSDVPGSYTGWHTYGVDWEPGSVTYYYDGKRVGQLTQGITGSPMYLLLDLATGGWGGRTVAPSEMKVDYVRVWQH